MTNKEKSFMVCDVSMLTPFRIHHGKTILPWDPSSRSGLKTTDFDPKQNRMRNPILVASTWLLLGRVCLSTNLSPHEMECVQCNGVDLAVCLSFFLFSDPPFVYDDDPSLACTSVFLLASPQSPGLDLLRLLRQSDKQIFSFFLTSSHSKAKQSSSCIFSSLAGSRT